MTEWFSFLSPQTRFDWWTIAVAVATNTSCAILGCYLVLRRMSLLGDAISHAVLAGVAFAFLATGSLNFAPMFLGAVAVGLLTAFLTQSLQWLGNVPEDSSMGVVFTSLFALGVLVVDRFRNVHLDVQCVLEGNLEYAAIDVVEMFGAEVPRSLLSLVPMLLLTVVFVTVLWKELKLASFDPMLATAMGLSAVLVHYLLMAMVAGVTVTALGTVGAIMAVAMLIVPAATAQLLCDDLRKMMLCAVLVGLISAVGGVFAARWLNTSTAGVMAVVAGLQFVVAVFFAPRHGLAARVVSTARLGVRIAAEDLLALLYRSEEKAGAGLPANECLSLLGGGWRPRLASQMLRRRGHIVADNGTLQLTEPGRRLGRSLVRSHRLWEAYLQEHFELPPDHLHDPAERLEHFIGPELQDKLSRNLARPERDPHGSVIPREGG